MSGLFLAVLDMRFPTMIDKVEQFIDDSGEKLKAYTFKNSEAIWFQICFSALVLSVILIGGFYLFSDYVIPNYLWVIFWISVLSGSSLIIVALLGDFIELLNRFSVRDQAISTLGVFLAVVGFILNLIF